MLENICVEIIYYLYIMSSKLFKNPIMSALFVSFISTFLITLNIYNGDLIKLLSKKDIVSENIEYMLWFLGPLLYLLFNYELSEYPLEYFVLILGVLVNVYWNRYSPWSNDTDRTMLAVKDKTWENEKKLTDVLLTGGGIIPEEDMEKLYAQGVGKLFGPGTAVETTIQYIHDWINKNK